MGSKIYVGNLSFETSTEDLEQMVAEHGTVSDALVVSDRDSGRSRGFGFVQMESNEGAQAAIDAMDGKEYGGRKLTVNIAKPREDRKPSGGGGGRQY